MSSTLARHLPSDDRRLGALAGAGLGLGLCAVGTLFASALLALGIAALVLAVPLGWVFGPDAVKPGRLSAYLTSGFITVLAVPLGALLISVIAAVGRTTGAGGGVVSVAGGALFMTIAGLVLFGLPLAGLTFVVAGIWVAVVRRVARARDAAPLGEQKTTA